MHVLGLGGTYILKYTLKYNACFKFSYPILQYKSFIKQNVQYLKYNLKSEKDGAVWKVQIKKKDSSDF